MFKAKLIGAKSFYHLGSQPCALYTHAIHSVRYNIKGTLQRFDN